MHLFGLLTPKSAGSKLGCIDLGNEMFVSVMSKFHLGVIFYFMDLLVLSVIAFLFWNEILVERKYYP